MAEPLDRAAAIGLDGTGAKWVGGVDVDKGIFGFTWRHSRMEQIFLLAMIAASWPFLYFSLNLPKQIVNQAIGGKDFPKNLYGFELEQLQYLATLSGLFLLFVFINGGFKYVINVFQGIMAERLLRRLRYMMLHRVVRFPLPHFRKMSQGELVAMVTAEAEMLGGFVGDAFALPLFQGGILATTLFFIAVQDPLMGVAAISMYPIQGYIIPKLQIRVNRLGKARVKHVRRLSERIGELVQGIGDVHANDTSRYEMADFGDQLGNIFDVRFLIYRKKFFIKFLNAFLGQLTPFLFYSAGGYLVITQQLSFGSLVAVLAAYKDLNDPWKELINYYQRMADAQVKYEQLTEQFEPSDLIPETLLTTDEHAPPSIEGPVVGSNVVLADEDGNRLVDGAGFHFALNQHVAIVGPGGGGKTDVARLLARQLWPTGGRIVFGATDLAQIPEAVTGRRIGYVDRDAFIRAGTMLDNLLYGIRNFPPNGNEGMPEDRLKRLVEAKAAGNSPYDIRTEWIDFAALGWQSVDDGRRRGVAVLRAVGLEEEVFAIGMRTAVDPEHWDGLAEGVLRARAAFRERLKDPEIAELVEVWDEKLFNTNATVAENILFGTPIGPTFDVEHLGDNPYMAEVLNKTGLTDLFLDIGQKVAGLMLEIFRDLPPGHEFFERFSFIDHDDLPDFARILNLARQNGLQALNAADRGKLLALPFKQIPARHRLGLIDEHTQKRLLEARRVFADALNDEQRAALAPLDSSAYRPVASVADNILFGKVASHRADAARRLGEELTALIRSQGLYERIVEIGLNFEVGISGKRLTAEQRQKLAIARVLMKQPQMLVVNEAAAALDASARTALLAALHTEMKGRALIWVDNDVPEDHGFDVVLRVDRGKVVGTEASEQVAEAELATPRKDEERAQSALGRETELLGSIPFFAGMDASKLKLLAFASEQQVFEPGQLLVRQGEMGDKAYVIVDGSVDILLERAEAGPLTIATRLGRELIGEMALLTNAPRTATVRARERVSALVITSEVFFKLIQENPSVSMNLTRILAKRLTERLQQ
jgi:putative ABC transport system ATP-binding protein